MEAGKGESLGAYLRGELKKACMSLRELARESGLDPSTVSRLMSGKQRPRPEHLVSIARILGLNVVELWQAAGYIGDGKAGPTTYAAVDGLTAPKPAANADAFILPSMEGFGVERIQAELEKYQVYGQTEEGREMILRDFEKKVVQVNGAGPFIRKLKALHRLYLDEKTDPEQKRIIAGVLLYFIIPTDIIPDYLFPIGYLDDAMAIDLVWQQVRCLVDESEVVRDPPND